MKRPHYTMDEVRASVHGIDSWWTRFFIDPIALRLTYVIANFTPLSPNAVTFFTLPLIFVSAYFFFLGDFLSLIIGAFLYEFNFALDCVDGKLARLQKKTSSFGAFFDIYLDNINVFINLFALVYGQYRISGKVGFVIIGFIYLFAHMTQLLMKYLALEVIDRNIKKDFYAGARSGEKRGMPDRLRVFFAKRGLSPVLFTTVEGEAFVFFFGPISGYVFPAIVFSLIFVAVFFILKSIFYFSSCVKKDKKARA